MRGFTDIHSHVIYGVDDGAKTQEDMFGLLDLTAADGTTRLYATSHVELGVHPFAAEVYQAHLEEARNYCAEKGYELELVPGAEVYCSPLMIPYIQDQRLPTMGESNAVLLEFSTEAKREEVLEILSRTVDAGYDPILAHIERYQMMGWSTPGLLKRKYRVLCQVNAGSFVRKGSLMSRLKLRHWLKQGWIDYIASDAHSVKYRPPMMRKGYEKIKELCGTQMARDLTNGQLP